VNGLFSPVNPAARQGTFILVILRDLSHWTMRYSSQMSSVVGSRVSFHLIIPKLSSVRHNQICLTYATVRLA